MAAIDAPQRPSPFAPDPVLILGASARAAAWSALRAGLSPSAADLFADRDLAAVARCLRVDRHDYPGGLIRAAERLPASPWFYTGGLENRPDLVARLARARPLWGLCGDALAAARAPLTVASTLRAAGLPAVDVRIGPAGLPRDGSWLCKPLASAGGHGIEPLGAAHVGAKPAYYYQERIDGLSLSAVFIGTRSGAVLAGMTRQLIGRPGAPFAYRGSVAPWPLAAETVGQVAAIGLALGERLGLIGLFGVDLVVDAAGAAWTVEVNPRYTASVEAIELSTRRSLVLAHRRACVGLPIGGPWPPVAGRAVAREVLFAERDLVFGWKGDIAGWDADDLYRAPTVGDVPLPGTRFSRGEPVLTVFGAGKNADDALDDLARQCDSWRAKLLSG